MSEETFIYNVFIFPVYLLSRKYVHWASSCINRVWHEVSIAFIHIHDCIILNDDDSIAVEPPLYRQKGSVMNGTISYIRMHWKCYHWRYQGMALVGFGSSIGLVGPLPTHPCVDDVHFKNIRMPGSVKVIYIKWKRIVENQKHFVSLSLCRTILSTHTCCAQRFDLVAYLDWTAATTWTARRIRRGMCPRISTPIFCLSYARLYNIRKYNVTECINRGPTALTWCHYGKFHKPYEEYSIWQCYRDGTL